MILEKVFECCYCGEPISFLLDLSVEFQAGAEDCEVCCQPIDFKYHSEEGLLTHFEIKRQDQ